MSSPVGRVVVVVDPASSPGWRFEQVREYAVTQAELATFLRSADPALMPAPTRHWSEDTPGATDCGRRRLIEQDLSCSRLELVTITTRAGMWMTGESDGQVNVLASALLTYLHQPVRQVAGSAVITGLGDSTPRSSKTHRHDIDLAAPVGLTQVQSRAFTSVLRLLLTMPAFLALHAQAGRLAKTWIQDHTDPPCSGPRSERQPLPVTTPNSTDPEGPGPRRP